MPCRLEGKTLNTKRRESLVDLLTVHYHFHILNKAVDDLECLRCGDPSLVQGESVQPLKDSLDVFLSTNELLEKFSWVSLNQVI